MENRIAKMRKEFGLNQTQLAQKLNTTQANISSWEHGKWQPDNETLVKLSIIFHCTIDYLLCKSDEYMNQKESEKIEPKEESRLTEKQRELLDILEELNIGDINKIIGYAESLKQKEMSTEEKIKNLFQNYKKK